MTRSLDQLRRQAKTLRKSHEAGAPQALARLKQHPPRAALEGLKHSDYLHVIAQEQGFQSWPRLKLAAETEGLDRAMRQQRLKIALAHGQNWVVEELLRATPDLARGLLGLEIALYDRAAVEKALTADPGAATRTLGPRRPILHLAFSRYIHARPDLEADMLAIAAMLHKAGADVNDAAPVSPDNDHPLSALYGALGHANNMVLARWLLDHGANPDDGESLYHSTELGHHDGLRMLLEAGADPRGTNALLRAMDFHDHAAVALLLAAGAHPDDYDGTPVGREVPWVIPALHQAARRGSDARMIGMLLDAGADPARIYEGASAYAYARAFGNRPLARAIEDRGLAPKLDAQEAVLAAAAEGRVPPGAALDLAALAPAYRNLLHELVSRPDRLGHMQALVALGFDADRPDSQGLTPVQIAGWEGLSDAMAYLMSLGPDLHHVNGYGGTLLSTIIHGAENCPARASRDHLGCLRLALNAGLDLPPRVTDFVSDEDIRALLDDWSARRAVGGGGDGELRDT